MLVVDAADEFADFVLFHEVVQFFGEVQGTITVPAAQLEALFAMTPYYWKRPATVLPALRLCRS